MKERPATLLVTAAAVAALAGVIRRVIRQRADARQLKKIRTTVEENLVETRAMHRDLRRTRGAVNQIHQYLVPVPKGGKKSPS